VPTILVASDAPTVRRQLRSTTSGPGITVTEARSGPAVVEACLAEEAPDLVIVDLQMGNMGGMAVCLELRLNESYLDVPHVPVLMLLDRPCSWPAAPAPRAGW
jgi:CheY-like chemotaxis protein